MKLTLIFLFAVGAMSLIDGFAVSSPQASHGQNATALALYLAGL